MHEFSYGFGKLLDEGDFDTAVETLVGALAKEGFGVITRIDVQQTLKEKLGVEFRRYIILGACNPGLAELALEVDPHIGLLLPCNVVVQERNGSGLYLAVASPRAMFQFTNDPELRSIAMEAERRLRHAVEAASFPRTGTP